MFEKIRDMISQQLDIDAAHISMDTEIFEDLGADSLDLVELLMEAEEEWLITIDEDEIKNFKTVGDVVRYIEDNM